ncbi:MAG: UDP-N-acetylmuramoyl-L-alanine--D-glutamate ligase [Deltaproteobacteria bacterium]
MRLERRHALVVGLGKSGVAAAKLLLSRGAQVIAADDGQVAVPEGVIELRRVTPDALGGIDLVIASPGVPLSLPLFAEARARRIELCGEVELASRFIEEPIAGITGTNGKSTTTALTGHLLAEAGLRVFTGGNLGNALSNRVLEGGKLDATVCELSSYQLESIVTLRCAAATVLTVTPDHLDRYPDLDAYAAAKARIFENQRAGDTAAVNAADARVRAMKTNPGVRRVEFDPREPLCIEGTPLQLRAATLRGAHNRENAFAACLLARHFGVDTAALQRGLDTYPGLSHRVAPVRVLDGVEWINASKATNVDSVEKSLTAFPGNVHVIMGGRGKGAPYAPLRELMRGRVTTIFTIGEDATRIASELEGVTEIEACGVLATAVFRARERARCGDVVLLSPACASYDQFRNFEDRGDQFKALVRGLS